MNTIVMLASIISPLQNVKNNSWASDLVYFNVTMWDVTITVFVSKLSLINYLKSIKIDQGTDVLIMGTFVIKQYLNGYSYSIRASKVDLASKITPNPIVKRSSPVNNTTSCRKKIKVMDDNETFTDDVQTSLFLALRDAFSSPQFIHWMALIDTIYPCIKKHSHPGK